MVEKYRNKTKEGFKVKKIYSSSLGRKIVVVDNNEGILIILFNYDCNTGNGTVLKDKEDCIRGFDTVNEAEKYLVENVFSLENVELAGINNKE